MNLIRLFPTPEVELATLPPWYRLDSALLEKLVLLASFVGLTLILLLWALFIRKRRPRSSRHLFASNTASTRGGSSEANASGDRSSKSRRRRRRDPRPRNPTLAETRGLPPLRTQEPPETAF